jgi:hypothetical protein
VVNRRKPHVQTPVVSHYPAPTPVDDFVLLFLPPCGPHLTPLATSSQAYLSLHSSEAPQGIDLSHPLFTCTNANQAATCTCNTWPRVSPHYVVNHSSQPGAIIHRSSDAPVLNDREVGNPIEGSTGTDLVGSGGGKGEGIESGSAAVFPGARRESKAKPTVIFWRSRQSLVFYSPSSTRLFPPGGSHVRSQTDVDVEGSPCKSNGRVFSG